MITAILQNKNQKLKLFQKEIYIAIKDIPTPDSGKKDY